MPWKHNGKTIRLGKSWIADDGTQHPATWSRWSDDDKKSKGLTWENPLASEAPYDDKFYLGRQTDGALIERKQMMKMPKMMMVNNYMKQMAKQNLLIMD